MAILAGDALLTLAFQVLARHGRVAADRKIAPDRRTGHRRRHRGRHDRRPGGRPRRRRQAAHARRCSNPSIAPRPAPCCAPACAWAPSARAPATTQYQALSCYGEHVGLAFQIVDDILDVEESSAALGKTAGKDAAAAQDHLPGRLWRWRNRAAWRRRSARAPTRRWRRSARAPSACTSWPT